jgi:signal-transduction protein with cAMP-binding, CBS, and nucleotidyltransferase domain
MAQMVRDVMSRRPVTVEDSATVLDAARAMRDANIGDVIVVKSGSVCGIVTDRDIVVRAVAEGRDPKSAKVGEICSAEIVTVTPDDPVDKVVSLMREKAIRRVPVVEGGRPVGVISLGDLAKKKDENSALAEISSARPNR